MLTILLGGNGGGGEGGGEGGGGEGGGEGGGTAAQDASHQTSGCAKVFLPPHLPLRPPRHARVFTEAAARPAEFPSFRVVLL